MGVDTRWRGRTALVTGASSGIGAAIAKSLAAAGLRVIAAARRRDRLEELAHAAKDGAIVPLEVDLRDSDSIANLFSIVRDRFGGVDILINNAGLGHDANLLDGDTEAWREMLEVNVLALCIMTREAISDLRKNEREGYIIHISSMSAHRVPAGSGVYSATKFAVRSLTEGLRQELLAAALPVRVTSISPGYVETEFAANYHRSQEAARQTYSRFPVLQPTDVAEAVSFLLSQPEHVQYHDMLLRPRQQPS